MNVVKGDGCVVDCQVEKGYVCQQMPSRCQTNDNSSKKNNSQNSSINNKQNNGTSAER